MTLTSEAFVNKKRNKQTSHDLQNDLEAAAFQFVHQVEKADLKYHKMTQNSVSSSY